MTDKIKGVALKPFKDSGAGTRYEAGKSYLFSAGAFANYAAAGLVKADDAAATAAANGTSGGTKSTSSKSQSGKSGG